jgi:hypothetical protein
MLPLIAEPDAREKKPEPSDLPPAIQRQIEKLVGAKVTGSVAAFGGLSVSAGFIFTFDNGQKIFAKGAHPGDTAHGTKNLGQEVMVYESLPVLSQISPPYLGIVSDGEEDGWMLGLWRCIDHDPKLATPARVYESLKSWQRHTPAKDILPHAREHNYISQFLTPEKKWIRLRNDQLAKQKFVSMFVDAKEGLAWFDKHVPSICQYQARIDKLKGEEGLMHGDLRLDNFLFGPDRTYVVDWPNSCWGPLVFDLSFLFSNMEALGFGSAEDHFLAYAMAGGVEIPPDDYVAMMAALSGHFADQAYREVPDKMPRLRWMQKSMLLAQLKFLARLGIIESPPLMQGQNQQ